MAAAGPCRAFPPGTRTNSCASCRPTKPFSPVRTAAARAAVWDAFLRQDLDLLPATLPDALRASSSALLTDLTALDYDALERTLEFLANNSAAVAAQALPGQWNAASGTYTVTDASRAAMQTVFQCFAHRGAGLVLQRAITQHQRARR